MHQERKDTIDAHQNRVKQLQDNFLLKIKTAGQDEVWLCLFFSEMFLHKRMSLG
jgi:hypothetical protein